MNGEKSRYTHILFDLDGTLSDPKEGITGSVQYALKALGIDEPDADKLEPFIGPPLKDSFQEFYGLNEEQADFAVQKYRERFKDQGIFENTLYPGMKELLKRLNEAGCVLAVASSKPEVFVNRILNFFGIGDCFKWWEVSWTARAVGRKKWFRRRWDVCFRTKMFHMKASPWWGIGNSTFQELWSSASIQ